MAVKLQRARVRSVAICFLHSYQNSAHERAAAKALARDGIYLCASHEISPEFREYERSSTTVVNAYVGPLMEAYLGELARARQFRIAIMQSNGGFLSARDARRHAVRTVLSGPAGGVVGALETARASGFRRVLGFDMGGTSTDVSLSDGAPRETTEAVIDGLSHPHADARYSHGGRGRGLHRSRGCGRTAARRSGERRRGSRPGLLRHGHGSHGDRCSRGAGARGGAAGREHADRYSARRGRGGAHCRTTWN